MFEEEVEVGAEMCAAEVRAGGEIRNGFQEVQEMRTSLFRDVRVALLVGGALLGQHPEMSVPIQALQMKQTNELTEPVDVGSHCRASALLSTPFSMSEGLLLCEGGASFKICPVESRTSTEQGRVASEEDAFEELLSTRSFSIV
jgi:hypothetical protein